MIRAVLRALHRLVCVGVLLVIGGPLLYCLAQVFFREPLAFVPANARAALSTLAYSLLSTATCTAGGLLCAIILRIAPGPLRRIASVVLTIPLLMPPAVVAISLHTALGSRSTLLWKSHWLLEHPLAGAVFVNTVCYVPLVFWVLSAALRGPLSSQERHALLYMPWPRVIWRVTLPNLRRELAIASLLVFVLSLQNFDICNVVGLDTLMNDVFIQAGSLMSNTAALATAMPLVLCGLILAALAARLSVPAVERIVRTTSQDSFRACLPARQAGLLSLLALPFVLAPLVIVWNLAVASGGWANISTGWRAGAGDLLTSAAFSLGAVGVMLAAVCLVMPAIIHRARAIRLVSLLLILAAFVVPPSVLSICVLECADRSGWPVAADLLHGRSRIVLILALRYLLLFVLIIGAGWLAEGRRGDQLATIYGIRSWPCLRHVRWPLMRPYVAVACILGLVFAMRELELYVLHAPPGSTTLSMRIFNALHFGSPQQTASFCLLLAFASLSPLLLLTAGRRRMLA